MSWHFILRLKEVVQLACMKQVPVQTDAVLWEQLRWDSEKTSKKKQRNRNPVSGAGFTACGIWRYPFCNPITPRQESSNFVSGRGTQAKVIV